MGRKTRSFTGCTTCRARKVKCDLTRPKCMRCNKSNLKCGGYDIVLGWIDPLMTDPKNNQLVALNLQNGKMMEVGSANESGNITTTTGVTSKFQRRNVELVKFPRRLRYETYLKLNKVVNRIDEQVENLGGGGGFQIGPFGVYEFSLKRRNPVFQENLKKKQRTTIPAPREVSIIEPERQSIVKDDPPIMNEDSDQSDVEPLESVEPIASLKTIKPNLSNQSIFSKNDNSYVHYNLLDSAKLTILAIKGPNYKFNEQNMFHILYPIFFPNIDSDDWESNGEILKNYWEISKGSNQVIVKKMFSNIIQEFTSDILTIIKINFEKNYFDTLLKPYIRSIICEFLIEMDWRGIPNIDEEEEFSNEDTLKSIKLSIIYLLISLTLFKKSKNSNKNIKNNVDQYFIDECLKHSIEIRKLAHKIVNYQLDEYDINQEKFEDDENYEILMIIMIIFMIQIDLDYGVFENLELLYAIADNIMKLNKWKKLIKSNGFVKWLMSLMKILSIFYESTQAINFFNYSISQRDEKKNYGDLDENYDLIGEDDEDDDDEEDEEDDDESEDDHVQIESSKLNDNYKPMSFTVSFNERNDLEDRIDEVVNEPDNKVLIPVPNRLTCVDWNSCYVMYGLPSSLINLLHEIVHLTNHKNIFSRRHITPRNFPRICAEIEDRLLNFKIEKYWNLKNGKSFISKFHQGLYYNFQSMHNAMIVYFYRLIKGDHLRNYQQFIELLIDNLIKLKNLNLKEFKSSFWPILICGSDIMIENITLRKKFKNLWDDQIFDRCNYWRSKQILFEIWKRREVGEDHSFMDLVREWGIILSLI